MPIVTISRGTFSGGRLLAEELARKLACQSLDSEILGDAALALGVPVSRLKAAMVKAPATLRRFQRERSLYLAAITAEFCERALKGDVVYHGHAAHLLLPGVSHVLRVRVVADLEYRINAAMTRMGITREQAKKYVRDVDGDRARWVDFLYGVDWTDPSHYDTVLNVERVSVPNAATALCAMAELPEFKATPASLLQLRDLLLASKARVKLAIDPRTARADVVVKAQRGELVVQHTPQHADLVPVIRTILSELEDVKAIQCSIAATTLLWVQEGFDPASEAFAQVAELARRWDAAVELLRVAPEGSAAPAAAAPGAGGEYLRPLASTGGVILEGEEPAPETVDETTSGALDALRRLGRAGAVKAMPASQLPRALDPAVRYSLVVVGRVFGDRPESVRSRLSRELRAAVGEHLAVPVVGTEELRQRLRVGPGQVAGLVAGLALVAATYFLLLTNQAGVTAFMTGDRPLRVRVLAAVALMIGVPGFAWVYGSCIGRITKLLRFD